MSQNFTDRNGDSDGRWPVDKQQLSGITGPLTRAERGSFNGQNRLRNIRMALD